MTASTADDIPTTRAGCERDTVTAGIVIGVVRIVGIQISIPVVARS